MALLRHDLGKLVARSEHEISGADLPPVPAGCNDGGSAAADVDDVDRCEQARTRTLRAHQQSRRDVARIDGEIVESEQRGGASNSEAPAQCGAVEKQRFQAGGLAQFGFAPHRARGQVVSREVKRVARLRLQPALTQQCTQR